MTERSVNKVVNTHWFGGIDKLPPNTRYIGRPSPYGNQYSSKSGKYIRDECVALHRVDLYQTLVNDPTYLTHLKHDLDHCDLACWCKQPKRVVGCHGDNYLHVLSPQFRDRVYDRTVIFYLMEDLRIAIKAMRERIWKDLPLKDYLFVLVHFEDMLIDIDEVLMLCREKFVLLQDLQRFIAILVIDLELAVVDPDIEMVEYRFDHIIWNINRFIVNRQDREFEPTPPSVPMKRGKKG